MPESKETEPSASMPGNSDEQARLPPNEDYISRHQLTNPQPTSSQIVQISEFLPVLDQDLYEFFQEITSEIQKLGCSRAEAVARINEAWGQVDFETNDIVYHEEPKFWAYRHYYEEVLSWDEGADRSNWKVRDAPPPGSASWTLKEEVDV
ncbi:hypothetical protein N7522_007124 [Penicillium canescens]|nr:hypothetical protein N7522_007124 [Penicillium canescens]